MARARGTPKSPSAKRPIVQYDHKDKKRANNPPVGLVTPEPIAMRAGKPMLTTRISIPSSSGPARPNALHSRPLLFHCTSTSGSTRRTG
jgi:hypothetical protein